MQLFYRKLGQGKPLIILHGLFGSGDNWQTQAKKFSEHFEVFVVDQRNHGQSPHSDIWTYEAMAEDLLELMNDNFLSDAILLGHSMGGKTAMYFTLRYPHLVDKLIVVDMAPKYYPPHHTDVIAALDAIDLNVINSRKEAEEIMNQKLTDAGVKQFLLKNLYWQGERLAWRFNLDVIKKNIILVGEETLPTADENNSKKLSQLPTMFIKGERSNYIKNEDAGMIKQLFPAAEIITIPDSGHWVQAEQPQLFYDAVMGFLRD
jgi:esterase